MSLIQLFHRLSSTARADNHHHSGIKSQRTHMEIARSQSSSPFENWQAVSDMVARIADPHLQIQIPASSVMWTFDPEPALKFDNGKFFGFDSTSNSQQLLNSIDGLPVVKWLEQHFQSMSYRDPVVATSQVLMYDQPLAYPAASRKFPATPSISFQFANGNTETYNWQLERQATTFTGQSHTDLGCIMELLTVLRDSEEEDDIDEAMLSLCDYSYSAAGDTSKLGESLLMQHEVGNVGVFKVTFTLDVVKELSRSIKDYPDLDVLVLDIRRNIGGYITAATQLAAFLMRKPVTFFTHVPYENIEYFYGKLYNKKPSWETWAAKRIDAWNWFLRHVNENTEWAHFTTTLESLPKQLPNAHLPKKIAVLTDGDCQSACDVFLQVLKRYKSKIPIILVQADAVGEIKDVGTGAGIILPIGSATAWLKKPPLNMEQQIAIDLGLSVQGIDLYWTKTDKQDMSKVITPADRVITVASKEQGALTSKVIEEIRNVVLENESDNKNEYL
eukprot:TRINITY_DN60401_c0_g1_i1.p1 TRINITY_DN60401_c0_g1~~TRINITY_DN60401_c0_g1_i1.p1  ORF type:complete len:502 (-),score=69.82 TRINITY_DN60401_c0_g1_i1:64-1569(-)